MGEQEHELGKVGATSGGTRLEQLGRRHPEQVGQVARLLHTARRGLATAYDPSNQQFAQTVRAVTTPSGIEAVAEGTNLRYAVMAGLGLARLDEAEQKEMLAGTLASELIARAARRAETSSDPGAIALAAWAVAEVNHEHPTELLHRLGGYVRSGVPVPTVDLAWMVTALTNVRLDSTGDLLDLAVSRLLGAQGEAGIFPHHVPAATQSRWRAHVGSFADQVYPVQALARCFRRTGDPELLEAANRTAARLCQLQGNAGQWWWHYDTRTGGVVERFPVYSVHQHAMAPMILADLAAAGGVDHLDAVATGLRWLASPPETAEEMVSDRFGLVWRKVGRREPPKAARGVRTLSTWVAPDRDIPGLDRLLRPGAVDHECRPYELGWMLYTWLTKDGDDA